MRVAAACAGVALDAGARCVPVRDGGRPESVSPDGDDVMAWQENATLRPGRFGASRPEQQRGAYMQVSTADRASLVFAIA